MLPIHSDFLAQSRTFEKVWLFNLALLFFLNVVQIWIFSRENFILPCFCFTPFASLSRQKIVSVCPKVCIFLGHCLLLHNCPVGFHTGISNFFLHVTASRDRSYWPKNIPITKSPQFHSDLAEILAVLPTHGLIILTKFDEDQTKIVDFLLVVCFWASIIFMNQSLVTLID